MVHLTLWSKEKKLITISTHDCEIIFCNEDTFKIILDPIQITGSKKCSIAFKGYK